MTVEGCNGAVRIRTAFYLLPATTNQQPAFVNFELLINGWMSILTLPVAKFNSIGIRKECPLLQFQKPKDMANFNEALIRELIDGLADGSIQSGYYFKKPGAITLPDGQLCFLRTKFCLSLPILSYLQSALCLYQGNSI